jgi:hypothetical protein
MIADPTPGRVPPRALAAGVLLALALGSGLVGAAIDRLIVRAKVSAAIIGDTAFHPLSSALRSPPDADRRQYRAELTEQLKLTAAQELLIDSIMAHRSGQFRALREEIRPRVEELVGAFRGDIEQVLTPDQRSRFRSLEGQPIGPSAPDGGNP